MAIFWTIQGPPGLQWLQDGDRGSYDHFLAQKKTRPDSKELKPFLSNGETGGGNANLQNFTDCNIE